MGSAGGFNEKVWTIHFVHRHCTENVKFSAVPFVFYGVVRVFRLPTYGYCGYWPRQCGFSAALQPIPHSLHVGGRNRHRTCCLCHQAFRLAATAVCRDALQAETAGDAHQQIRRLRKHGNRRPKTRDRIKRRRLTQGRTFQEAQTTYVIVNKDINPYLYWSACY